MSFKKKNATGTDITNTLKNKIFGLKKKLNISDVEFKNMVDNLLGTKNSKAEYDGARLKSGMSKKEFDTQLHNRLLNDLTIKDRAASIKKDIVKLGGNEVYYLDSPLKENYPRVFKALQRIGAGMETAKFQLSKHPIGRKMASRMINTDASIGALTGKYLTMMESVEIGGRFPGTRRKKTFFDMTDPKQKSLLKI